MTDILVRNVDDATIARIDGQAASAGLSRNEYLRRRLDDLAHPTGRASSDDLVRSVRISAGLLDDELMRGAWE